MSRRVCSILAVLLALLVLAIPAISPVAEADGRDRLAPVTIDAPPYAAFPPRILTDQHASDIQRIVLEAREFGVPHAVRVIATPVSLATLDGAGPTPQDLTQRLADEWLDREPIESTPGADDGILLLVVIPRGDHAATTAAYATGEHALPQNGLTRERIDRIITDVMTPRFAENQIGAGIAEGTATLSYENLFVPPPRIEPAPTTEKLQRVVNGPLAFLTLLTALALLGGVLWIAKRRDGTAAGGDRQPLSPFAAGAIARGRADATVTSAALLHLARTGAIDARQRSLGDTALMLVCPPEDGDPFLRQVWDALEAQADPETGRLNPAAVRRLAEVLEPARRWLEDDLARRGLFRRKAKVETVWIVWGCAVALVVALYVLTPAIIGMARWGIFAIATVSVAICLALWWASHRSWATPAGHHALGQWEAEARSQDGAALALYETIVHHEALWPSMDDPTVTLAQDQRDRILSPG